MKRKGTDQAAGLRSARKRLGITTEELAALLGKSLATLRAWLLPKGNRARRNMPASARMLLERILKEHRNK